MKLFANDLSIHGQFYGIPLFRDALARLMAMRNAARRFGREVYCHRAFLTANPMPNMTMQQALGRLASSERRAAMVWLTRGGPFWDNPRQHGADDWLECRGEVVTDSAVGEAAYRKLHERRMWLGQRHTVRLGRLARRGDLEARRPRDWTTKARLSRTGGKLKPWKITCKHQRHRSGRGTICEMPQRAGSGA